MWVTLIYKTLLIKLRRCHVIDCLLGVFVCQSFASFSSFLSGITLDADKLIVNVMKLYIERNILQVELI